MEISEEKLREWFDAVNPDEDGQVAIHEITIGSRATAMDPLIMQAFQEEQDKDKVLTFEEFKEYVKNIEG